METKKMVNRALGQIGEHGLSGISIANLEPLDALAQFLDSSLGAARKILSELRRQHLAEITHDDTGSKFQLTPKGIYRLQQSLINDLRIPNNEAWDRKWRIIMFDVPTRHNKGRTQLTKQLKRMGFVLLRDSTWAYPHSCFAQLNQLVSYCNLQQYVTYAEVSKLDTISQSRLLRSFPNLI